MEGYILVAVEWALVGRAIVEGLRRDCGVKTIQRGVQALAKKVNKHHQNIQVPEH
jgi:hypothetical protein